MKKIMLTATAAIFLAAVLFAQPAQAKARDYVMPIAGAISVTLIAFIIVSAVSSKKQTPKKNMQMRPDRAQPSVAPTLPGPAAPASLQLDLQQLITPIDTAGVKGGRPR